MSTTEPHMEKLKYIFDNAKVGIAICNAEDNILELVNPAFAQIHGYEPHELIGASPRDVFAPECMLRLEAHENVPSCTIDDVAFETTHFKKDGSLVAVSVHITVIKDEQGKVKQRIANIQDISNKKQEEEQLRLSQEELMETKSRLSSLISTIPDLIWMKDEAGVYLFCNSAYEEFMGVKEADIIGKTDYDFYSPNAADLCKQTDFEAMSAGTVCLSEETITYQTDASFGIMEIRKAPIYHPDGTLMGILGIARDITERRYHEEKLSTKEREFRSLAENSPDVIIRYDCEGRRVYVNPMGEKLFGCTAEDIVGKTPLDASPIPSEMMFMDKFHTVIQTGHSMEIETAFATPNGGQGWGHMRIVPEFDTNGNVVSVLTIGRDISERKTTEKKIEYMAHHDALTGLPNRILAQDRTEKILIKAQSTEKRAALLFIDLDGFKTINDSMGHSIGDEVLKTVALRLTEGLRSSDIISRQGGDEFLLILSDIEDINDIVTIANKLLLQFENPFHVADHPLSLSASIGIAIYPEHGNSFESLLQSADMAMYKAKESGKNGYYFYTNQMNHNFIGQFKLQNDLKSALQNNDFVLYYQPQIDLVRNCITGVEALIRWKHPELGMIPPMNFIPIAETNGLIVQIGQWVIEEACRQAAQWHNNGMKITVAVNISAVQFKRGNLETVVKDALKLSGLNPHFLELELTESILIHDAENILKTVQTLKELGIQLSIDDFGTGYSSLAYLKRFAVDKLKIDQSFIRDILRDQEDAAIVRTIIQMAKSLNLKTIAEGVENASVLTIIDSYGCDEVQGYHFAKPLDAAQLEDYYANFNNEIIL